MCQPFIEEPCKPPTPQGLRGQADREGRVLNQKVVAAEVPEDAEEKKQGLWRWGGVSCLFSTPRRLGGATRGRIFEAVPT